MTFVSDPAPLVQEMIQKAPAPRLNPVAHSILFGTAPGVSFLYLVFKYIL
jgi:hypothetical protein